MIQKSLCTCKNTNIFLKVNILAVTSYKVMQSRDTHVTCITQDVCVHSDF
jgi:hypothetical protein